MCATSKICNGEEDHAADCLWCIFEEDASNDSVCSWERFRGQMTDDLYRDIVQLRFRAGLAINRNDEIFLYNLFSFQLKHNLAHLDANQKALLCKIKRQEFVDDKQHEPLNQPGCWAAAVRSPASAKT